MQPSEPVSLSQLKRQLEVIPARVPSRVVSRKSVCGLEDRTNPMFTPAAPLRPVSSCANRRVDLDTRLHVSLAGLHDAYFRGDPTVKPGVLDTALQSAASTWSDSGSSDSGLPTFRTEEEKSDDGKQEMEDTAPPDHRDGPLSASSPPIPGSRTPPARHPSTRASTPQSPPRAQSSPPRRRTRAIPSPLDTTLSTSPVRPSTSGSGVPAQTFRQAGRFRAGSANVSPTAAHRRLRSAQGPSNSDKMAGWVSPRRSSLGVTTNRRATLGSTRDSRRKWSSQASVARLKLLNSPQRVVTKANRVYTLSPLELHTIRPALAGMLASTHDGTVRAFDPRLCDPSETVVMSRSRGARRVTTVLSSTALQKEKDEFDKVHDPTRYRRRKSSVVRRKSDIPVHVFLKRRLRWEMYHGDHQYASTDAAFEQDREAAPFVARE